MKRIFIGSSSEAKHQATLVADILRSVPGIEPILWYEYFDVGEITFLGIEKLASILHGAVLLATPDDDSVIRGSSVLTPRANVLFEYGYLTAALGRNRVALCRYEPAQLPSDFHGLTYVSMGGFNPNDPIASDCSVRLVKWAENLADAPLGLGATQLCHGLSGRWNYEVIYELWRRIPISGADFAVVEASLHLDIPADGLFASGNLIGRLQTQVGNCFAEFRVAEIIRELRCTATGGLIIKMETYSRQLLTPLLVAPPQTDGYEQTLKAAQTFQFAVEPDAVLPKTLVGVYETYFAGAIYSKGRIKIWR